MDKKEVLIEVKDLKKYFQVGRNQTLKAVDGVNFKIYKGETLGIVGESGCGKTTCGKTVMGLYKATGGEVLFDGVDINKLNKNEKKEFTKRAQIIFQDPYSSLKPRMTVYDLISAPLEVYKVGTKEERREMVEEILQEVGLDKQYLNRFPHEFSGGQRQRIGFARALILNPEFVVCDEAVSALDVSVRAQVLNLMRNMQQKKNLTYLFISHDLSVVRHISDRIAVMYLGSVVEIAEKAQLYSNPMHPYTKALLSAIPLPDVKKKRQRIILEGDVPSAYNPPSGCKFHTRCPYATDRCRQETPVLQEVEKGHKAACHRALELA